MLWHIQAVKLLVTKVLRVIHIAYDCCRSTYVTEYIEESIRLQPCPRAPRKMQYTAVRLICELVASYYRLRCGGEGLQYTRGTDTSTGLALETAHLSLILPLLALDVKTAR